VVTLLGSLQSLKQALVDFYGYVYVPSPRFPIFVEPGRAICFDSSDPEYAAYKYRLDAVCAPYHTVEVNAAGGYQANTYGSFTVLFDALPDDLKYGPIMVNLGELSFLLMLLAGDADTPSASWYTTYLATVQEEFTRQGLGTASAATPMATWKQAAIGCVGDCCSYALANGASRAIFYGSSVSAFSQSTGPPRAGFYSSPPDATHTWWEQGGDLSQPGIGISFANAVTAGKFWALGQAQFGASAQGVACYSFLPDGTVGDEMIPYWASGILGRKNPANSYVSPDFAKDDLYYWHGRTFAQVFRKYREAMDDSVGQGTLDPLVAQQKVAAIIFPGGAEATQVQNYVQQQRMSVLASKEPARFVANSIEPMFSAADANSPLVGPPDEIWFWDAPTYFWITLSTLQRSASSSGTQKTIDRTRIGIEKRLFGRPARVVGEPFGSATWTDHDTWNAANSLGDSFWNSAGALWWTTGGGSQLTAPCVLDPVSGPLAPWLDTSANITREHVIKAIRHWLSDHNVTIVEQSRAAITATGR
jgi:hypothetical protein